MLDDALTKQCYVDLMSDYRGESVFYFELVDGRAREVTEADFLAHGKGDLQVWLQLATINGRTRCIGVDIRGYDRPPLPEADTPWQAGIKPHAGRERFAEIGSAVLRSIPIGDLIERAITGRNDDYEWLAEAARSGQLDYRGQNREEMARRYESLIGEPGQRRRGPERVLSLDDLTNVVALAYRHAGNKPVVAVRDALSKHRGKAVTMDQARKAVVRAREAGALPPAHGQGKP
jgi:hypothetical protein